MACGYAGALAGYLNSASNTMVVGRLLGELTGSIQNANSGPTIKTGCLGHSLGGQVCGFAGRRKTFDGIIALDPAGPLFDGNSENMRLNKQDGKMVYAFHVSPLGMKFPVGGVDYYFNGGFNQPGCSALDVDCSHSTFMMGFFTHVMQKAIGGEKCHKFLNCNGEEDVEVSFCLSDEYCQRQWN